MLSDKLLGRIISETEKQTRKVDVTNRILGLLAKVKPGNLNSATSVPVASTPKQSGSIPGVGASENNDAFFKLIEYSKLTSENSEKTSNLTEKMLKIIESKFGLFNDNLIDIKEGLEEDKEPVIKEGLKENNEPIIKEEKPKENFNFFKEVSKDIESDYNRVKSKILDFVVPGRSRMKEDEEKESKQSKEPKRPKVIPLVATPIQTAVANVEQNKSFDTVPIIKAMDRNTVRLIDKLDELKSMQGGGGGVLGGLEGVLGGAAAGAAAGKIGGALKGGASAAGRMVMSAAPTLAAGAVAVAGGAAVDYGLGKLGVGKDEQGNDIQVNEQQDDANWQKMTTGQKIQSGLARGIEKIGDTLFLGNMARQARIERIRKETDYFQSNTKEVVKSNEASTPSQKVAASNEASTPNQKAENNATKEKVDIQFSELTFAQKDPENYKKFIEYRDKRSEEIYSKRAEKFTSTTSDQRKETARQISQDLAKRDAVLKFKNEIEAAGAGSVKTSTSEQNINNTDLSKENSSAVTSNSNISSPSTTTVTNSNISSPLSSTVNSNISSPSTTTSSAISSNSSISNSSTSTPDQKAEVNTPKIVRKTTASDYAFTEPIFSQNDPENYKKFRNFRDERTKEIYEKTLQVMSPTASFQTKLMVEKQAERQAKDEAVFKFRNEIKAAGAGSVNITPSTSTVVAAPSKVESVKAPTQAGMIKELTTKNEQASMSSAPPIIVNNVNNQTAPSTGSNSVQSLASVPTSRNTNSTIERVMTKNAFFTLA